MGFSYNMWLDTKIKDFFINDTLQKQIQNYIILLLFLSLSILAFITFVYFNFQYKNIYYDKLQQNTNVVVKNFKQLFLEYYPTYGEETYNWVIANKLQQRSDVFEIDITAYNTNGDMLATSNPEIYKNHLVSKKMNSEAYYALYHLRKSKFIGEEKIGKLSFLSLYIAIVIDGNTKLYLQFPHYNLDKYLQSEIVLFLIYLINIYVLFLILIAFAAVFLSKSITNSLAIIANHIQKVQLDKKNIQLEWNKNDEIGLLVKQYNRMLFELEKSAIALAKSEREGAWSEMAKQVAHEIKNPLTPMKLSIQHLQRALYNNDENLQELTLKISNRLIEQIDILSDIASAFSDFAKLPSSVVERIDFIPILTSIIELFRETNHVKIYFEKNLDDAFIMADKNQMNRVFTNLFKNAIQAIPSDREGVVNVDIQDAGDLYQISIKDNGNGIPKDKASRIFEPNFTTKSSGTGLGLAICKNIMESINGKIWFVSEENTYTIFYLEIPKDK
jgi:signal transduction histidine kinase